MLRNNEMVTSPELVSAVYKKSVEKILEFRKIINRPLTLSEKIISPNLAKVMFYFNQTESHYKMLLVR